MTNLCEKILKLLNEPCTATELAKKLGTNVREITKLLREMINKQKEISSKKIGRYTVFWRSVSPMLHKVKNLESRIRKLEEENKNLREKLLKPGEIDKLWLKLEKWRNYAFKLADFLAFQKGTTINEILRETGAPLEDENP
ncbi:MAG: hypothetical protein ACTSXW_07265 [Candidatus Baldrarchaeia archaeon]